MDSSPTLPNPNPVDQPVVTVASTTSSVPTPISSTLSAKLDTALHSVPADKQGALTASVSLLGAEVQVAQKLSSTWTAGGWAGVDWTGNKSAGLRLTGAW